VSEGIDKLRDWNSERKERSGGRSSGGTSTTTISNLKYE
jgi:hypothetical protein